MGGVTGAAVAAAGFGLGLLALLIVAGVVVFLLYRRSKK
jgi:hypothetical protein